MSKAVDTMRGTAYTEPIETQNHILAEYMAKHTKGGKNAND